MEEKDIWMGCEIKEGNFFASYVEPNPSIS